MPVAGSIAPSIAALSPGSFARFVSHSSSEMSPSLSASSVSTSSSNGTNFGASPPGQPPSGSTGFLRGSDLSSRLSSFCVTEPEWSQSI